MLRITDRHERELLYGPTNEEMITDIFRGSVKSYKDLPKNLYHIQWKFRDERRPRFGVMRGREFLMKDAYSFDLDAEGARKAYNRMFVAYLNLFSRMGLKAVPMRADTGPIGGDLSHEFIVLADTGESAVFCHKDLVEMAAPGPDVDWYGDLQPLVDQRTALYAATEEMHDEAAFAAVPEGDRLSARGIEVGHIFSFGTKYSEPMKALVTGPDGKDVPVQMGSYGVGVSRLLGAIIEASHDEGGIIWPESVAPFGVGIINMRQGDAACDEACETAYKALKAAGRDPLYDDTDTRGGAKFATMDLIGVPWQLIVGPKGIAEGVVEIKNRKTGERHTAPLAEVIAQLSAPASQGRLMALGAGPFGTWERTVAWRYLRNKRKNGGVALIAIISFAAVMLAVFALITVMSVMNGFRAELLGRLLGFNGHVYAQGPLLNGPDRDGVIGRIKAVRGVTQAAPMVEAQAMVIGPSQVSGAIVRGVTPADLRGMKMISSNIKRGSLAGFGEGEYGGDIVLIGDRMARNLGLSVGDAITLISPSGPATAFGTSTREKDYTVGGIFSVGMSQFDESFVYMALPQAQLFFGRDTSIDYVEIKVADPDKAKEIKPIIEQASGPGAFVQDWMDKNSSYFNALQVERKVMRLILFFIVAIATLNIISALVMLVKNKGRDIAILRTMGASQASILRIFIMAGASIGLSGTLAGLLLGVLFCANITAIQAFVEWLTGTAVFSADIYFLAHIPAKIDWSRGGQHRRHLDGHEHPGHPAARHPRLAARSGRGPSL
jgi:lipoprotein-releasing system permease protein